MNVLTIAGSDPSSGAGIQGDLKTFEALGLYGLSVVTAITSQNTSKFFKSEPASPDIIRSQIRSVLSDFKVRAIKIGMVYDKKTIGIIHGELKNIKAPIILDPIFKSTTGGALLQEDAFSHLKKLLMPLAHVITPNVPEAEKITSMRICTTNDAKKAALKIKFMGAKNVVIKGGHMKDNNVTDLLLECRKFHTFSKKRIQRESHGGGCIFSAALCGFIAKGKSLPESVRLAQEISFESIRGAAKVGTGIAVARQKNPDTMERELSRAIGQFIEIEGIYKHIPEVQTNFVYCKPNPKNIADVLGLEGRLVKTGNLVQVSGVLKYGGSRHVGNAVLEVSKKFPATRSALNIRYDRKVIEKALSEGLRVAHYDRRSEPYSTKGTEGKTVSWGTRSAILKLKSAPDMIYHMGDFGKEPMTLVFGKSPRDVLTKLAKIT